ncbi:helix-turn-helix domain-containing protein [Arthrobacter sp. 24S4-2]|uniref:AraC family transcriptional regulator n=1 Tax=Arthrobacter sp. 24S4-2 TaxID=2575374 RepID=UPI0010C791FE|nr:AraC family transcriptional regulator [Arthrobacter sp. 24S4-2]QCO98308.1 helix-turn-helix domain-containing protein [Arthrobacter sp. 24S4-2]
MGQPDIRPVRYTPSPAASGEIELMSLRQMRKRGGLNEFVSAQRLDFDLLFRIDSGSTTHTVDFQEYLLAPGDAMWVRAGQVQQWGSISDIDGPVLLFTPAALENRIHQQITTSVTTPPNHFPADALSGSSETDAALAQAFTIAGNGQGNALRRLALAHAISVALLLLVVSASEESVRGRKQAHEAFIWFRENIDENFRTRRTVQDYAARLGYSTRTLNRLSRENTGLTAKQLIDERIVLEAKRALAHGASSVATIAEEVGFDDPSNFSKYFRQRVGIAPAAFRDAAKGEARQAD